MDVYLKDKNAYVEIGNGYMLCIGTKAEVEKATTEQLVEMIHASIAINKYQGLTTRNARVQ